MKTGYRIWRTDGRPSYREGSLHDTLDAAKAATGVPDATSWSTNGEGDYWPINEYQRILFIGAEQVPESVEDRVQLAIDLIVECRGYSGDHHQKWLTDQVVRILAGDRYEQVVAEWLADRRASAGEDSPFTFEWDEGVAP